MSDFLLQKSPARCRAYHVEPGISYSDELRRWFVTSPALIRQILSDENFVVAFVDLAPFNRQLGIDIAEIERIISVVPLIHEGSEHRLRREQMARLITRNSAAALDAVEAELGKRIADLADIPGGEPFCLYRALFRPVVLQGLLTLSGLAEIGLDTSLAFESLPQVLDSALPISRKRKANDLVRHILAQIPADLPEDDRLVRTAILALGVNTLLGSVSLTAAQMIGEQPGKRLCDIGWSSELLRTSVPYIERRAAADARLGGTLVRAGEQLRLFIEAAGLAADGRCSYSDLFFGTGSHKCLGLSFSRQSWSRFAAHLSGVKRRLRILEMHEREQDYLFNYPDRILVTFDD